MVITVNEMNAKLVLMIALMVCSLLLVLFNDFTGRFLLEPPITVNYTNNSEKDNNFEVTDFREMKRDVSDSETESKNKDESSVNESGDSSNGITSHISSGDGDLGIETQVKCYRDSDCDGKGVREKYCSGKNVLQDKFRYKCINPGKRESYCSVSCEKELIETCNYSCYDGKCITENESVNIFLSIAEPGISSGNNFTLEVWIDTKEPVFALQFKLLFEYNKLSIMDILEGNFFKKDGSPTYHVINFDKEGELEFGITRFDTIESIAGDGIITEITFYTESSGKTKILFEDALVVDEKMNEIPIFINETYLKIG